MKKILFIITAFSSGGAEHQLQELSNSLVERGYEIEIATFGDLPDHYELDQRIKRTRIAVSCNKTRKLWDLWKHIFSTKAEIVFTFGQRESLFAMIPLLLKRQKFLVGERNTDINKYSRFKKLRLRLLYKRANIIIPNSHTQGQIISENFPSVASKIHVITNYTDVDKYACCKYENNGVLRVCIFARYSLQKNYMRFAEALKNIKGKTPIPIHFDWYGNKLFKSTSLEPHYIKFKDLVSTYGIEDMITLHDSISDVASVMTKYDAFCLPSMHEGFSNSISEAISCGLPSLVSNVSDNKVMVKDGINGFLFDPLRVSNIEEAIIRFANLSFDERRRMSLNSRKIAESLFDKKTFISNYCGLFDL